MKCNVCNTMNEEGAVYCSNCGEYILKDKKICYSCNETVDNSKDYCPNCNAFIKKGFRICAKCGKENSDEYKFCTKCKAKNVNRDLISVVKLLSFSVVYFVIQILGYFSLLKDNEVLLESSFYYEGRIYFYDLFNVNIFDTYTGWIFMSIQGFLFLISGFIIVNLIILLFRVKSNPMKAMSKSNKKFIKKSYVVMIISILLLFVMDITLYFESSKFNDFDSYSYIISYEIRNNDNYYDGPFQINTLFEIKYFTSLATVSMLFLYSILKGLKR